MSLEDCPPCSLSDSGANGSDSCVSRHAHACATPTFASVARVLATFAGTFKYVLIRARDDGGREKLLVRGERPRCAARGSWVYECHTAGVCPSIRALVHTSATRLALRVRAVGFAGPAYGYHDDIFQATVRAHPGLSLRCLGGGRIAHGAAHIKVYGFSQAFGRANHEVTVDIIRRAYPTYAVEWSNEGY
jgi:hypothetical protein